MQLPKIHRENHEIDNNAEYSDLSVGNYLYYAPDGTIHYITDSGPMSFELKEEKTGKHWKVTPKDLRDNLFSDFFPLKLTGHYPN